MARKHTVLALTALAVACFGLRSAHIWFELRAPWKPFESEKIARNLVEGRGYSYEYYGKLMPTANAPPGLVFVLASLYASGVPEPDIVFRFLQAGLAAASLILTWLLAQHAFDRRVAWVAALLFLVDLNLSFSVTWIQETALTIFFTLAALWALVRLRERPGWGRAVCCGLLFGLGMLVRPTLAVVFAAGLGWFLLCRRSSAGVPGVERSEPPERSAGDSLRSTPGTRESEQEGGRFAAALIAVVTAAAVLSPWTYRNYRVFGRFIPVSQNLGLSLWYGNNPRATGSQVDAQGKDLQPERGGELWNRLVRAESEVEINQAYLDAATDFMREHPGRSLWLRMKCFAYFWLDHNYWLAEPRFPVSWRIKAANIVLVALFAGAVLLNFRRGGSARLLLATILATCLTYTLIHADVGNRYRVQIEPLILIYVAQLLVEGTDWLRRGRRGASRLGEPAS